MSRAAFGRTLEAVVVSGLAMLPNAGCVHDEAEAVAGDDLTARMAPVGLALEVNNGEGVPLAVRRGQSFYLNQIDLRASLTATVDEGVSGLRTRGDFAGFQWSGISREEHEFVLLANPDGTFRRRQFYRDAVWMNENSVFAVEQIDAHKRPLAAAIVVAAGVATGRRAEDGFFDRRIRAIQWTNDCKTVIDCTGARAFEEEALVELRYAMHRERVFTIAPDTAALRVTWSLRPERPYTIPVTQVAAPRFGYGASVDVEAITPPRADGTYPPGSDLTFRITLKDGAGNRLHPPGSLPTYNEVVFGANPAGIQYYRAFFDPTTTYWRRKHRERMLIAQLIGPAQAIRPVHSIIDLDKFLNADDVQLVGTIARDGMFAEFHTFPTAHDLFGGAFDPAHAGWAVPVPDTWTHHLPPDAPAGTYLMTVKGRRTYLGEDVPFTRTIELQVGAPRRTQATLDTGPCNSCHAGPSALGAVLHGNANRAACAGCHVPLGFELEGPVYVRTHFIHSRSRRLDAPLAECAACHLTRDGIQRVSKSACMSCHRSYPPWHAAVFGPIQSIYVGGGRESFEQCTSACHRSHPHSRL
ncbi:MAG TPA: hypothetical protein VFK02_03700 [Kofleriaceae bacterium]|nr:hypothetical protein [Kofleriaceae bacterium]